MRITPYHHYALYEPDASPDLTESGEYNSAIMGIDADSNGKNCNVGMTPHNRATITNDGTKTSTIYL